MRNINKKEYDKLISELATKLKNKGIKSVYGVPKNGSIIAESLWLQHAIELKENPDEADAMVDDLIDSGRTRNKYEKYKKPFYVLVDKKDNEWIHFWFEKKQDDDAEDLIVRLFENIGENPNREGLKDTPKRVVKMWKEIFRGYDETQKPKITVFDNGVDGLTYDNMVIDTGDFYSQCEHHMVPFFGQYWFAYIPDKKILGISKVARLVDFHSSKLQIQERLVKDVLDDLEKELQPLGIALVMKGEHLCKTMRGVKKKGYMITSDLRGVFKEKPETRAEFMRLIK